MKYTILGFNQKKSVEFGLKIEDLLILRYFVDFKDSGNMTKKIINEENYYWLQYDNIKLEFPILNIKKDTVYRKLKKMTDIGILKRITLKEFGTYSFYNLGPRYMELVSDSNPIQFGKKSVRGTEKNPEGYGLKSRTNNPSTNNPSTNNNNLVVVVEDIPTAIDYFQKNICELKQTTLKKFINICSTNNFKLIEAIIDNCTENNAKSFAYFKKVIDAIETNGIKSEQEFKKFIEAYRSKNNKSKKVKNIKKKKDSFNNFQQRSYDFEQLEKDLLGMN